MTKQLLWAYFRSHTLDLQLSCSQAIIILLFMTEERRAPLRGNFRPQTTGRSLDDLGAQTLFLPVRASSFLEVSIRTKLQNLYWIEEWLDRIDCLSHPSLTQVKVVNANIDLASTRCPYDIKCQSRTQQVILNKMYE